MVQAPWKFGGRFSRKAVTPSRWSLVWPEATWASASPASAPARSVPRWSRNRALVRAKARVGPAASADRAASASRWRSSAGQTRLTSPNRSAWSASTQSPAGRAAGQAQCSGQSQRQPGSGRDPVDHCNGRLGHLGQEPADRRVVPLQLGREVGRPALPVAVLQLTKVLADAERPAAPGQGHRPHAGVAGGRAQGAGQRLLDRAVERVERLRPVERDPGRRPVAAYGQAHGELLRPRMSGQPTRPSRTSAAEVAPTEVAPTEVAAAPV